jgi:hypothetical protein
MRVPYIILDKKKPGVVEQYPMDEVFMEISSGNT